MRDYLLTHVPLWRSNRDRVLRFVKLEGIQRLLQILEREKLDDDSFRDLNMVPYHKAALEVLEKCVLSKCAQDVVASYKTSNKEHPFTGFGYEYIFNSTFPRLLFFNRRFLRFRLLMRISIRYVHNVPDVMNLALHVLANCVYGLRTGVGLHIKS